MGFNSAFKGLITFQLKIYHHRYWLLLKSRPFISEGVTVPFRTFKGYGSTGDVTSNSAPQEEREGLPVANVALGK